MSQPARTFFSF